MMAFFRKLLTKAIGVEETPASGLELKLVQAMHDRALAHESKVKSFNSIILKFPKIDQSFQTVRDTFKKFDQDDSGTIDLQELKTCFRELKVDISDDEVKEYLHEADMDSSHGISFKEFIITLAILYLVGPSSSQNSKSRIALPQLEAALETVADAFIFFDKDKDGYVSKAELNSVFAKAAPGGRDASKISMQRFAEMDWDHNGSVTFKEFLFAFADWVGVEDEDEEEK